MAGPPGRRDAAAWAARTGRILDRAAESVLEHGYDGTTIAGVAGAAEVAKGTIYLHFPGRDALFAAVLRRERLALVEDLCAATPAPAGPADVLARSVEAQLRRPLLRAVLRRDRHVLGHLTRDVPSGAAVGLSAYLDDLHGAGLVRTDRPAGELFAAVTAVAAGLVAGTAVADDRLPALVADAVHRLLDRGTPLDTTEAAALATVTAGYLAREHARAAAAYRAAVGTEDP